MKEGFHVTYISFINVEVDLIILKSSITKLKQKKIYQRQNGNVSTSLSPLAFWRIYYVLGIWCLLIYTILFKFVIMCYVMTNANPVYNILYIPRKNNNIM